MATNYFEVFPKTEYKFDKNDDLVEVTDITKRVGIRKDFIGLVSSYYKHNLSTEDRPEVVADIAYEDSNKHWMILHANEVVDPYHDWIKSVNSLEEYVDKRYPNRYIQTSTVFGADCPLSGDIFYSAPTATWPDGVVSAWSFTSSPPVASAKEWDDGTYESVSTTTGGSGTGAIFDVIVSNNKKQYDLVMVSGGKGYAVSDVITLTHPSDSTKNDLQITVSTVNYYTLTGLNMKTGGSGTFTAGSTVTNGTASATVVSWVESADQSYMLDRSLVVKNITGGTFSINDTITMTGGVSWDVEKVEGRSSDNWRADTTPALKTIDVLELETGITGQMKLLAKGWKGIPLANDEYWSDSLITGYITGGDWFTKGNTLRNMTDWNANVPVEQRPPDLIINKHIAGKVISSDSSIGVIIYKIITPSNNGGTDFTTNEYLFTKTYKEGSYPNAIKVDVLGKEKDAPKYYEITRTNDDGTTDRVQVDSGSIGADNTLANGFTDNTSAISPTPVSNWEYEIRENEKRREVNVVNLDLIDQFEAEYISKMSDD